jgi:hypothetical protein
VPRQEPPRNADYYSEYSEPRSAGYRPSVVYDDAYGNGRRPPPPPTPWYRGAPALVGIGALAVLVVAGIAVAAVKLTSGSTPTSVTTSSSSAAPTTSPTHHAKSGGGGTTVVTQTVPPAVDNAPPVTDTGAPATDTGAPQATDTGTAATAPPATDTGTPTTTPPADTSTVTSTQTVTVAPSREPYFPRRQGQPGQPGQ